MKIVSEAGVAAGVRRIEALTGNAVVDYYKKQENMLRKGCKSIKNTACRGDRKDHHMQAEIKVLHSENESRKASLHRIIGDVMKLGCNKA